ncbi:hypothetical protein Tco_1237524 [Tanacetum coccineum]
MENDFEIYRGKKERIKSIALKAKKESSDDETLTSGSCDGRRICYTPIKTLKSSLEERDAVIQYHLIGDCPKPSRNKDQKAFIGVLEV